MNKVFLAGRLASDPQQFVTQNGITQSRISIACSDNWNKNETYFFPCVAWQSTANYINTYFKKGDAVVMDGKLIRRSYVSKEGKTVYVMEVVIETIKHFGNSRNNSNNVDTSSYKQNNINMPVFEEEIKFDSNQSDEDDFDAFLKTTEIKDFDVYNVESPMNESTEQSDSKEEFVDLDWMKEI